jgi:hypothetical protein
MKYHATEEVRGMPQYSDAFGAEAAAMLREANKSPYEVERESGGEISHQTVRNMVKGQMPNPALIVTFALTLRDDPNRLLDKTGWNLRWTGQAPEADRRVRVGDLLGSRPGELVAAAL